MIARPAQADQRRRWLGTTVLGAVIGGLTTTFVLLEHQRREQQQTEVLRLHKSMDGVVIGATFLIEDVTADQLDDVAQHPQVASLSFSNTSSLEGGLQHLQRFDRLSALDLSGTDWLTAADLDAIAALPHLRHLNLSNSCVSDAGLAHLASSSSLETLALDGCEQVTDAAIDTLQKIATLRSVWIEDTGLTLQGFQRLRTSRRDLLIGCEIGQFLKWKRWSPQLLSTAAPADELTILLEIPHDWMSGELGSPIDLHEIRHLRLSGPSPAESMEVLAPRLSKLHSLSIPASALSGLKTSQLVSVNSIIVSDITPDDNLENLTDIGPVENLELEVVSPLAPRGLKHLAEFRNVETIQLSGPGLSAPLLAALAKIPGLRSLRLQLSSPLSPDALQSLTTFPDLQAITLRGPGLTNAAVDCLAQIRTLRSIYLELTSPPDPTTISRLQTLPDLTHLGLEGPGVSNSLVTSLTRFPALTQVYIANANVTDASLKPFLKLAAPPVVFSRETDLSDEMLQRVRQAAQDGTFDPHARK